MFKLRGFPMLLSWDRYRKKRRSPDGSHARTLARYGDYRRDVEAGRDGLYHCRACSMAVTFDRRSWVVEAYQSPQLLKHEQGHFDIIGLAARDLLAELRRLQAASVIDLNRMIAHAYRRIRPRIDYIIGAYDDDTERGDNQTLQRIWSDKIEHAIRLGHSL